jgi:hypothetical protein
MGFSVSMRFCVKQLIEAKTPFVNFFFIGLGTAASGHDNSHCRLDISARNHRSATIA